MVFYGDKNNWWAGYALWVFKLFGHTDVRMLDGGRAKWIAEGRDPTWTCPPRRATGYPAPERDDAASARSRRGAVTSEATPPLVDVRSPAGVHAASAPTCPTTRRKARCAAATSRAR